MRRLLILGALLAVAVTLFLLGRSAADEPARLSVTGTRYAVTVVIDGRTAEVRPLSGDPGTVTLSAVMPQMGHAMPETVAHEREAGRFRAEGELFPMTGVWELSIRLTGASGEETLTVKALISD
jgi:hypothetical protein